MKCCICGKEIVGYGNNPEGAIDIDKDGNVVFLEVGPEDRCCDDCNTMYVIPGRLYKWQMTKRGN